MTELYAEYIVLSEKLSSRENIQDALSELTRRVILGLEFVFFAGGVLSSLWAVYIFENAPGSMAIITAIPAILAVLLFLVFLAVCTCFEGHLTDTVVDDLMTNREQEKEGCLRSIILVALDKDDTVFIPARKKRRYMDKERAVRVDDYATLYFDEDTYRAVKDMKRKDIHVICRKKQETSQETSQAG